MKEGSSMLPSFIILLFTQHLTYSLFALKLTYPFIPDEH